MPTNLHMGEQLEELGLALGLEAVPGVASPLDVPFDLDPRLDLSADRVGCIASQCLITVDDLHEQHCPVGKQCVISSNDYEPIEMVVLNGD